MQVLQPVAPVECQEFRSSQMKMREREREREKKEI
jgi:hypothetical protein